MSRSLSKVLMATLLIAVSGGLAACSSRPLSTMDTFWFANTHPYLVQTGPAEAATSGPEY